MSKFQSRAGASQGILAYAHTNTNQSSPNNSTDVSGVYPSTAASSFPTALLTASSSSASVPFTIHNHNASNNKQSHKKRRRKKNIQPSHITGPSDTVDCSGPLLPSDDSMSVSNGMQGSKLVGDSRPQPTSNASNEIIQHKLANGGYAAVSVLPSPSSSTSSTSSYPSLQSSSHEFQQVQAHRRSKGNRHKLDKQPMMNGDEKQDSSKDSSANSTPSISSASAPPPTSSWTTVPAHRSSSLIHSLSQQRVKENTNQMNGKRLFAANPFPVSNSSTSSPLLLRGGKTSVLPSSPKVREGWESLQPHPTVAAMVARNNQSNDAKFILGTCDTNVTPSCNPPTPTTAPTSHRRLFDRESPACKSLVGVLTAANSSFKQTSNSTPPVATSSGHTNSLPNGASPATSSLHSSPSAHPQVKPNTTAPHPSHSSLQHRYLLPHPQSCVSAPPAAVSEAPSSSGRRSLFQVAIGDVINNQSTPRTQRRSRRVSISASSSAHSSRESSPYFSRSSSEYNSQRASPLLQQSSSAPASPAQSRALKMQLLVEKHQREREIMRQAEALRQIQPQLDLTGEGSENETEVTADDDDIDSTLSPCSLKRVSSTPQLSANHSLSATPTSFYANSRGKHSSNSMSGNHSLNSSFDRHRRGQAEVIATQMAQAAAVGAKQQAHAAENDESGNVTEHDDISHADDEDEEGDAALHLDAEDAHHPVEEDDGELINADSLDSDIDSNASFASDDEEVESPDAEVTSSGSRLRARESNASTTASNNSDSSTPNSSNGSTSSSSHGSHTNSPHDTDAAILTAAQHLQPVARRFSKLHEEILTICSLRGPTTDVEQIRRSISKRVSDKIWEKYPDVEVHVIGSCATNLFLPDSDIDLVIRNPQGKPPLTTADLYALGKHLEPLCNHVNVISTASVPLIKLVEREYELTVDLTLNVETGLYSTSFVIEQLEAYPEVLHQLTIVLKHYLKKECLNDLYSGGLPSYSLILMIVSFLQQHPQEKQRQRSRRSSVEESDMADLQSNSLQSLSSCRVSAGPRSPDADEDDAAVAKYSDWNQPSSAVNMTLRTQLKKGGQGELLESPSNSASAALSTPLSSPAAGSHPFDAASVDLGEYLLSFFYLYGKTFDYETKGISVRNGGEIFDKKERGFLRDNPFLLCLENPMDPTVDLGFKTFRIKEIQKAFLKGYETLRSGRGFGNATQPPLPQQQQLRDEAQLKSADQQSDSDELQVAEVSHPQHQLVQQFQQQPQLMQHHVAPLMYHSMPASPAFFPSVAPASMPDMNHFHLQQFPPASFSHPSSLPHSSSHSSVMHSANHSPYLLHANIGNGNMLMPTPFDLDSNSAPPAMHHMYHAGLLPFPPGVPLINNGGMPMNGSSPALMHYTHAPMMPMNHNNHMKTFKPPVPKPQKQRVNA